MSGQPSDHRVWRPLSSADLVAIEAILHARDPFRGMRIFGADWYSVQQIVEAQVVHGTEFWLMLDRNVFSGLLRLRPGVHSVGERERLVAAIMAFATAAGFYFDAGVALSEGAVEGDDARWRDEALALAVLQNVHPQLYADIALGRIERLDPTAVASATTPAAAMNVREIALADWSRFRPEYGAALKLALLIVSAAPGDPMVEHMFEFIRWCYDDYMFLPGAVTYGSLALSPSRCARMFKGVRGRDVNRALAGVRNATCDMGLVRDWSRRVATSRPANECHLLASLDDAVLRCADDLIIAQSRAQDATSVLGRRWEREWGVRDGQRLISIYRQYVLSHDTDASRNANKHRHQQHYWSSFVDDLEASLHREISSATG